MKKLTRVPSSFFQFGLINEDAIIIPCNDMMEEVRASHTCYVHNKNLYFNIHNKEMEEKYTPMKDGDIRIIEGIDDADLIYVKFPYKCDEASYDKFIEVYINLIKLIQVNEYKKALLPEYAFIRSYGYSSKESRRISAKIKEIINQIDYHLFDILI